MGVSFHKHSNISFTIEHIQLGSTGWISSQFGRQNQIIPKIKILELQGSNPITTNEKISRTSIYSDSIQANKIKHRWYRRNISNQIDTLVSSPPHCTLYLIVHLFNPTIDRRYTTYKTLPILGLDYQQIFDENSSALQGYCSRLDTGQTWRSKIRANCLTR
jgi:hypothetical protein